MKSQKVFLNGKEVYLRESDYKTSGGQGVIFLKNGKVFKIYHDVATLIPEQKIYELQELSCIGNVVIPEQSVYDKDNKRIGFTLKYIDSHEYLCKLFTASFKNRNKINIKTIADLVDNMRETLVEIHKRKVVVGDYNEMNFLSDYKFKSVFYIDTDSYQTPSFKCNAIMHSVRDRVLPLGEFKKSSDWFSWAVITFQMYTGLHPFKGKHPQYKFEDRMEKHISVYDKSVTIPKNINLSAIPKNHLDYYKNVFINKDRSVPPKSEGAENIQVVKKVFVDATADIRAQLLFKYDSNIIDAVYRSGFRYVLTEDSFYENEKVVRSHSSKRILFDSSDTFMKNTEGMVYNNILYTVDESGLAQHSFYKFGKQAKDIKKYISTVNFNSSHMFYGVVIQDVFGHYIATIPYELDKCVNVKLPELKNTKIIDASRQGKWLFIIYKTQRKTNCIIFQFDKKYNSYKFMIKENVDFLSLNVIVKSNGVVVFNTDDNALELFSDLDREFKVVENTPVYNDNMLVELHKTCMVSGKTLYELIS